MNVFEKSERIKAGLRKSFQDGTSKMAQRKCYGYEVSADGIFTVNHREAKIVHWIFEQYSSGENLDRIAAKLEQQGISSTTGKAKWNREVISKLLSNEKYTGRVLLQKTVRTGAVQIENDGLMNRYLYAEHHEAIIPDELFETVREENISRAKLQEHSLSLKQHF